jgi:hypothetical protein
MVYLRLTDSCNLQSQHSEFQPWTKCRANKLLVQLDCAAAAIRLSDEDGQNRAYGNNVG